MKKLLAILIGFALAAGTAEARTLYVNAKRPNNNGNGLKPATAKRTIQAAINIAKAGDTILVYPGWYAPIKTNDRKIAIKSVKGAYKTGIAKPAKVQDIALAQLGKTYTIKTTRGTTYRSDPLTKGANTLLSGFWLDGLNRSNGSRNLIGISGGMAQACLIQRLGHTKVATEDGYSYAYNDCATAAANARLKMCVVSNNRYMTTESGLLSGCTLKRCKIQANIGLGYGSGCAIDKCNLYNCLLTGNASDVQLFTSSALLNCTVAGNAVVYPYEGTKFSKKSRYWNCILRNNVSQWKERKWVEVQSATGSTWVKQTVVHPKQIHNVDSGNVYWMTSKYNRDPKFVNTAKGDFRLKRESPCINLGKLNATLKKLAGAYDLAGRKRIRGSAIDLGCYEY